MKDTGILEDALVVFDINFKVLAQALKTHREVADKRHLTPQQMNCLTAQLAGQVAKIQRIDVKGLLE